MGNTAASPDLHQPGSIPDHEETNSFNPRHHYIVHFISVSNIPASELTSECRPYIRSFIGTPTELDHGGFIIQKLSNIVTTPTKVDHADKSAIWQCYRDFYIQPPSDAFLVVEIVNAKYEGGDADVLGSAFVPVVDFVDEKSRTYMITPAKNRHIRTDVKFTVTLRRAFINSPPPYQKTIFLVRHGESKWNKAQAKGNIGGLLDRDHALTEAGVIQAIDLNQRWKFTEKTINPGQNMMSEDWDSYAVPQAEKDEDEDIIDHDDDDHDNDDDDDANSVGTSGGAGISASNNLLDLDFEEPDPIPMELSPSTRPKDFCSLPIDDLHIPSSAIMSTSPSGKTTPRRPLSQQNSYKMPHESNGHIDSKRTVSPLPSAPSSPSSTSSSSRSPRSASSSASISLIVDTDNNDSMIHDHDDPRSPSVVADDGDQEFLRDFGLTTITTTSTIILDEHSDNTSAIAIEKKTSRTSLLQHHDRSSTRFHSSEEAIVARRNEYILKFLHADAVYSSPLTRAIETAFMVMDGHPAAERGLTLYSHIREVKKLGGLDSVGMVYGNDIEERVKAELKEVIGRPRTEEVMIESLHYNDCNSPWWTSISSYESQSEQQDRVREFISFARYSDPNLPVFVGHSLFFKAFYSKRISNMLKKNRPEMASNMRRHRLSNATLMACTLQFIDRPTGCDAIILDADLIFGGGFHGICQDDDENGNNANGMSNISVSPHGSSISGAIMMERFGSFRTASAAAVGNAAESISSRLSQSTRRETIREIKSEVKSIAKKFINGLK